MTRHILLAEPSVIVANGISSIITRSNDRPMIRQVETITDIQAFIVKETVHVVIINPSLVQNKTEILKGLRKNYPDILWLAIIYGWYDQQLLSMFDAAIHINETTEQITATLEKALRGSQIPSTNHQQALTEREIEVLKLLVKGCSNKEIADQLSLSTHTIITHRKNITQRTGIKSASGLTIYAVVKKIVSLPSE